MSIYILRTYIQPQQDKQNPVLHVRDPPYRCLALGPPRTPGKKIAGRKITISFILLGSELFPDLALLNVYMDWFINPLSEPAQSVTCCLMLSVSGDGQQCLYIFAYELWGIVISMSKSLLNG